MVPLDPSGVNWNLLGLDRAVYANQALDYTMVKEQVLSINWTKSFWQRSQVMVALRNSAQVVVFIMFLLVPIFAAIDDSVRRSDALKQ